MRLRRTSVPAAGAGAWRSSARDMLRFGQAAAESTDTPVGRALTLAMTAISKGLGRDSAGLAKPALPASLSRRSPELWRHLGDGRRLHLELADSHQVLQLARAHRRTRSQTAGADAQPDG